MSESPEPGVSPKTWGVLVGLFRSSMYLAHYGLLLLALLSLLPTTVRSEGAGPERFSDSAFVAVAILYVTAQVCHWLSRRWRWDAAVGEGAVLLVFSLLFREWCGLAGVGY